MTKIVMLILAVALSVAPATAATSVRYGWWGQYGCCERMTWSPYIAVESGSAWVFRAWSANPNYLDPPSFAPVSSYAWSVDIGVRSGPSDVLYAGWTEHHWSELSPWRDESGITLGLRGGTSLLYDIAIRFMRIGGIGLQFAAGSEFRLSDSVYLEAGARYWYTASGNCVGCLWSGPYIGLRFDGD